MRRTGPGLTYEPPRAFVAPLGVTAIADLDGDGDLDIAGHGTVRSWRYSGPEAGSIRQYGQGTAGTGGAIPVLGASGPMRVGSHASLRARRAVGGTFALLVVGLSESSIPNSPCPGITSYASPWLFFLVLKVPGPPGVAGAGNVTVPITDRDGRATTVGRDGSRRVAVGITIQNCILLSRPGRP